jgi:hypothetical protein
MYLKGGEQPSVRFDDPVAKRGGSGGQKNGALIGIVKV